MGLLNAPRRNLRNTPAAMLLAYLMAACDGTGDLVREVDAARAGCTEELLKAGDEICVRMFERYADMAADGMETYIGGMRAFDEALQRRGGLLFDTAGLGRAIGGRWSAGIDSARGGQRVLYGRPGEPGYDRPVYDERGFGDPGYDARAYDERAYDERAYDARMYNERMYNERMYAEPGYDERSFGRQSDGAPQPGDATYLEDSAAYPGGTSGPVTGGRWSDPPPQASAPPSGAPLPAGPAGSASPAPSTTPARRGVLLPSEERLRRPWIDGAESQEPYLGDEPRRREPEPESAPVGPSSTPGWGNEPYPADRRGSTWGAY